MIKTISLREANQVFSRCIHEVEAGKKHGITRKGEPVARLVPVSGHRILTLEQKAARARPGANRPALLRTAIADASASMPPGRMRC
jgi:prevent-host-death family protein